MEYQVKLANYTVEQMQESLAKFCPQRYNADNPKRTKRFPSLPDLGKGRRAFLTTEPTTHRFVLQGNYLIENV